MAIQPPIHLLSSLGVLVNFQITKKISKKEVDRQTKRIRKILKESDPIKFQKLLSHALVSSTKKTIKNEIPPGLILPKTNSKKDELDRFYMELSAISQALANKFLEQKLTKHQVCFIVNAVIHILGITEEDFMDFHKKFQKYKENDFSEDD